MGIMMRIELWKGVIDTPIKGSRKSLVWVFGVIVFLAVAAILFVLWQDYSGPFVIRRLIRNGEHQLVYDIDHEILAKELRRFGNELRWSRQMHDSEPASFDPNDPAIPSALRILKPSGITIYDDRVEYDCGSPFLAFGIVVFREGVPGTGSRKLGDGIWFYSADGNVPAR